jgi:hypothetical protein
MSQSRRAASTRVIVLPDRRTVSAICWRESFGKIPKMSVKTTTKRRIGNVTTADHVPSIMILWDPFGQQHLRRNEAPFINLLYPLSLETRHRLRNRSTSPERELVSISCCLAPPLRHWIGVSTTGKSILVFGCKVSGGAPSHCTSPVAEPFCSKQGMRWGVKMIFDKCCIAPQASR